MVENKRITSLEDVRTVLEMLGISFDELVPQRKEGPITARVGDVHLLFTRVNRVTVGAQLSQLDVGEGSQRRASFLLSSPIEIRTDTDGNQVWGIGDHLGQTADISKERVVFGPPVLGEQRV